MRLRTEEGEAEPWTTGLGRRKLNSMFVRYLILWPKIVANSLKRSPRVQIVNERKRDGDIEFDKKECVNMIITVGHFYLLYYWRLKLYCEREREEDREKPK